MTFLHNNSQGLDPSYANALVSTLNLSIPKNIATLQNNYKTFSKIPRTIRLIRKDKKNIHSEAGTVIEAGARAQLGNVDVVATLDRLQQLGLLLAVHEGDHESFDGELGATSTLQVRLLVLRHVIVDDNVERVLLGRAIARQAGGHHGRMRAILLVTLQAGR